MSQILAREERISTGIGHIAALHHRRLDELETSPLLHSHALREWLKRTESAEEVCDLLRAHV